MVKISDSEDMNSREFFYLVSNMRQAQRDYFERRDQAILRTCKVLEKQVDEEIARVKRVIDMIEDYNAEKSQSLTSRNS